jgi:hypothetical protein
MTMSEAYHIRQTTGFKKDLKRLIKQGKDLTEMYRVVDDLAAGKTLDSRLSGDGAYVPQQGEEKGSQRDKSPAYQA